MKKKLNTYLLYIYTFLSTFILYYICDTLFYIERGINSSGYVVFLVITFLIQIILEIPSGIISDKYSRKKILLFSNTLFILATIIFIFSYKYYMFVIATIIKGVENSIVTGVANSMLYDLNKESFDRTLFIKNCCYNISYMLAMILGGYIGEKYGLVVNYYLTLLPLSMNFIVILLIDDNKKNKSESIYINKNILKNAIKEIKNNKFVMNSILTNSIIFSIIKLIEESHPEYSANIGLSVSFIGLYTALILIMCIIGNYIGVKFRRKQFKFIIYANSILIGICILLMGILNSKVGILFLLFIYIFSESYNIVMLSNVHDLITSKSRITIESIFSMILSLNGFFVSGIVSILLIFMNVYQIYIILGIIVIVYGIINMLVNHNKINIDYKLVKSNIE